MRICHALFVDSGGLELTSYEHHARPKGLAVFAGIQDPHMTEHAKYALTGFYNCFRDFFLKKDFSHRIVCIKHKNVFKLLDGLYFEKIQLVRYQNMHFKSHALICS